MHYELQHLSPFRLSNERLTLRHGLASTNRNAWKEQLIPSLHSIDHQFTCYWEPRASRLEKLWKLRLSPSSLYPLSLFTMTSFNQPRRHSQLTEWHEGNNKLFLRALGTWVHANTSAWLEQLTYTFTICPVKLAVAMILVHHPSFQRIIYSTVSSHVSPEDWGNYITSPESTSHRYFLIKKANLHRTQLKEVEIGWVSGGKR